MDLCTQGCRKHLVSLGQQFRAWISRICVCYLCSCQKGGSLKQKQYNLVVSAALAFSVSRHRSPINDSRNNLPGTLLSYKKHGICLRVGVFAYLFVRLVLRGDISLLLPDIPAQLKCTHEYLTIGHPTRHSQTYCEFRFCGGRRLRRSPGVTIEGPIGTSVNATEWDVHNTHQD